MPTQAALLSQHSSRQGAVLDPRRRARPRPGDRQNGRLPDLAPPAQMVEMLFAHLKRILKLDRLRLRGPCGARDEFHLAATAQNLRKLAKLIPAPEPIEAA